LRSSVATALARHIFSVLAVISITALGVRVFHVNATTVALCYLLAVLWSSTTFGLFPGITTSIASVLAFNFFFLPPAGTLTIQDPQNWVALAVFLATSLTASNLSARAERRALEAQEGRRETQRLYELGRAILVHEKLEETTKNAVAEIQRLFGLDSALFLGLGQFERDSTVSATDPQYERLKDAAEIGERANHSDWVFVPVRLGGKAIGALAMQAAAMSGTAISAIANLLAIALERRAALESATAGEAARISDTLRSALLDGLAHDLKTPLTAIKASITALMTKRQQFTGSTGEFLDIIHEETMRLQRTVYEAIETARLESGALSLRLEPHDLVSLLKQIAEASDPRGERVRIRVVDSPSLVFDWDLIRLAVKQIVDNALRYSPEGTHVSLVLSADQNFARLSVEDEGPGVAPSEQLMIFEKFYRGRAGKAIAGGTGIGLAVAKRIIDAHEGAVTVRNGADGGAIFEVRLPLNQNEY
jgi:two-component system sensor histidine kinase KdpD